MRGLSIIVLVAAAAMLPAPAHAAGSDPHPPASPIAKATGNEKPAAGAKPAEATRAAAPATAHAQTGGHKPAQAHKPATEHKTPDAKADAAAHASAKPALARAATAADLEALNERIQQRVAEVKRAQKTKASLAHRPSPSAPPRVRVEWRPSVSWPQDLDDAAAAAAGERVALTWNSTAAP